MKFSALPSSVIIRVAGLLFTLVVMTSVLAVLNGQPTNTETFSPPACRPRADQLARQNARSPSDSWRTNPDHFIAHGGGGIDGRTYTNSQEAVATAIRNGYRMLELDLLLTSDGFIVAAHDWKSYRERTGTQGSAAASTDMPMTLAEFRAQRIDGKYTPIDENDIRRIFNENSKLVLVTDKLRDFSKLAKAFPFQERVIVEVFSKRELALARAAGIANPMLSIGNLEASLDLVLTSDVGFVALSIKELTRCPGAAATIIASGRQVFAFTTDDEVTMEKMVGLQASAFYSDFWNVREGKCDATACLRAPAVRQITGR